MVLDIDKAIWISKTTLKTIFKYKNYKFKDDIIWGLPLREMVARGSSDDKWRRMRGQTRSALKQLSSSSRRRKVNLAWKNVSLNAI